MIYTCNQQQQPHCPLLLGFLHLLSLLLLLYSLLNQVKIALLLVTATHSSLPHLIYLPAFTLLFTLHSPLFAVGSVLSPVPGRVLTVLTCAQVTRVLFDSNNT